MWAGLILMESMVRLGTEGNRESKSVCPYKIYIISYLMVEKDRLFFVFFCGVAGQG